MADIKRMRYFDQQLLVLKDFTDEQAYHREMRRRHNQALHTTGVATGLDVSKTGAKEVTVKAGMAIDNLGQEVVLDVDTKIDLSNATLFPPNSSALVTISYDTTATDPYASDTTQNTRIKETFRLAAAKETAGTPPDPTAVQLARVVLDAQGNIALDLSVRRVAGASAFDNSEAALTVRSLRLSSPAFPIAQWPTLTASGASQMTLTSGLVVGSLSVLGDINLNGGLKAGADLSGQNLSLTGNLGVGTSAPQDKLHVSGGNMRLDNNHAFFIEDTAGAARRTLSVDQSNTLHLGGSAKAPGFDRIDFDLTSGLATMTLSGGRVGIGVTSPDAPLRIKQINSAIGLKVTANRIEGDNYKQPIAEFRHDNETQGVGIGYASVYATGSIPNQNLFIFARGNGALLLNTEGGGNVGIGTNPTRALDVRSANGIKLGCEGSGGGMLIIGNNPNDNKVWVEAFNSTGNGHAAEFLLTGMFGQPVPQLTLIAGTTVVSGVLKVLGGKVGYVVDQFINKLEETLEEGDVVVISQNQSTLRYGQHENIPIPEVDLAQSVHQTSVCGVVCEVHGELRQQPEGVEDTRPKTGRKSKKTVIAPQAFTPEEMEKLERKQVQPGQIGLMVTQGAFSHCKVDADLAPITIGDLLTTSATKGHAQKVPDPAKAVGSIIGKALGSLSKGKGKIPVMVMPQ
jgi:hypothetical protein